MEQGEYVLYERLRNGWSVIKFVVYEWRDDILIPMTYNLWQNQLILQFNN